MLTGLSVLLAGFVFIPVLYYRVFRYSQQQEQTGVMDMIGKTEKSVGAEGEVLWWLPLDSSFHEKPHNM